MVGVWVSERRVGDFEIFSGKEEGKVMVMKMLVVKKEEVLEEKS